MALRFALVLLACASLSARHESQAAKPNIIYILADDLGYGDVGVYGQQKIRTPNIDRLAAEGLRFTQHYAGNAVCAPSRCSLLTGKHMGHAVVRDNMEKGREIEGQQPMPRDTVTLAQLLKPAGYKTGIIGKWGLGMPEDTSGPNDFGFDYFYGYLCQRQAHDFYPTHLWRNRTKETLAGNTGRKDLQGRHYAHDLMAEDSLRWVRENSGSRFFVYLAYTIPHYSLQVPDDSLSDYEGQFPELENPGETSYARQPFPRATYAAMITRMDRDVGRLMALLKDLGIDDNTLVVFTSDNGATFLQSKAIAEFFDSWAGFRGSKGDLYEGGIRVPFIARWPGRVPAGTVTDHVSAFWDFLPTACELAEVPIPNATDGISFVPTLLGKPGQRQHDSLYWEIHSKGGQQAVRIGDWKAVRMGLLRNKNAALQLFDLKTDPGEQHDVSAQNPEVAQRAATIMAQRTPSPIARWNFQSPAPQK
jgi:arylsulfatase A